MLEGPSYGCFQLNSPVLRVTDFVFALKGPVPTGPVTGTLIFSEASRPSYIVLAAVDP
ncbi:hypothetical protein BDZ89DRAFT_1065658 [Hymenopellis radicata]|nr:hypothetical protein BDZ89DRAFT_1065658 [Hymenopellis radicata]